MLPPWSTGGRSGCRRASPWGGGLFEVRTRLDRTRRARILFCVHDGRVVLLHGFIKKTKTTPKADLDLARTRQKEVEA